MAGACPPANPKAAVLKAVARCAPALAEAGISQETLLGCGQTGCVFNYKQGLVVKLTCEQDEAYFCQWLKKLGRIPSMLPQVDGVLALTCADSAREPRYFAIIRETLSDYDPKLDRVAIIFDSDFAVDETLPLVAVLADQLTDGGTRLSRELQAKLGSNAHQRREAARATELIAWAQARKVTIEDLHNDNYGVRVLPTGERELVIRDLGITHVDSPGGPKLVQMPQLGSFTGRVRAPRPVRLHGTHKHGTHHH